MWPGLTTPDTGGRHENEEMGHPPGRALADLEARLTAAVAAVGADAGVVGLLAGRSLMRLSSTGLDPHAFGAWPLPVDRPGPLLDAATAGRPVWIATGAALALRYPDLTAASAGRAGGFLPILADGRTLGVLGVTFRGEHRWEPGERARLEAAAMGLADPLRALDARERRRRVAPRLDALPAEPSAQARLERAARLVGEGLGDDDIVILALTSPDGEWLERFGVHHPDPAATDELRGLMGDRVRVGENRSGRTLLDGHTVIIPEIDPSEFRATSLARLAPFFEQWPVHATAAVPLTDPAGETVGLLTTMRLRAGAPYDARERRWLERLGPRLGLLAPAPSPRSPSAGPASSAARRLLPLAGHPLGLVLAVALPVLLTAALRMAPEPGLRPSAGYLACIAAVAAVAGRREAAVATFVALGFYWVELSASDTRMAFGALILLALSAAFVVVLVDRLERAARSLVVLERREADRRHAETSERLATTERQALADSRFRSLVEATTSVTWRANPVGELVEAQPAWEAYTGQPWAQAAGRGWSAMIHPDDRGAVEAAWERNLEGASAVFEMALRLWSAQHQEFRHAVARAVPLRDRHGRVVEWVGAVSDIHEQVQALAAQTRLARELSESRARLAALMDADVLAFVFGEDDSITHANDAFLTMLGCSRDDLDAGKLTWPDLTPEGWEEADQAALDQLARQGRADPYEKEFLDATGRPVPVEIGVVALERRPLSWAAYVVDLRDRKATEHRLRDAYDQRDHVARTLQTSLLPPTLPQPDGLRFAARYLPSPVGEGVGGDFYDVYPTHAGDWHVVIGDVCGRGTDAAALTALSRYTLRAAAIDESDPTEILRVLNDAVLTTVEDGRFCTVSYLVLRPVPDDDAPGPPARWQATVTLGGHHPLRLLRDGDVITVGRPGTLIGVFPEATFTAVELLLHAGDVVVSFTDGLIEQQRPPFSEADLDALLASLARQGAGLDAVVAALEAQVAPEAVRDDDTAILAFAVGG
jgi:phosphoserine phosphatase RsbU/P